MTTPALPIEAHLRNRVRAAREAYSAAYASGNVAEGIRQSREVDDAEAALQHFLDRQADVSEVVPAPTKRRA